MYRVLLVFAFLTYCSSIPFTGSNTQKSFNTVLKNADDLVETAAAGYSYFRKQDVGARPALKSSFAAMPQDQDMSEYRHSSALDLPQTQTQTQNQVISSNNNPLFNKAFGQQKLLPRIDFETQPLIQRTVQMQQPIAFQSDRSVLQRNFQGEQSSLLDQQVFSNQVQDVQPIGQQQILLRPSTMNVPPTTLNAQRNQQQLNAIPQQPSWSTQQQFKGFTSPLNNQIQRPATSSFDSQSVQQPIVKPQPNTVFPSQAPVRRVISQSQSAPKVFNGGW